MCLDSAVESRGCKLPRHMAMGSPGLLGSERPHGWIATTRPSTKQRPLYVADLIDIRPVCLSGTETVSSYFTSILAQGKIFSSKHLLISGFTRYEPV